MRRRGITYRMMRTFHFRAMVPQVLLKPMATNVLGAARGFRVPFLLTITKRYGMERLTVNHEISQDFSYDASKLAMRQV